MRYGHIGKECCRKYFSQTLLSKKFSLSACNAHFWAEISAMKSSFHALLRAFCQQTILPSIFPVAISCTVLKHWCNVSSFSCLLQTHPKRIYVVFLFSVGVESLKPEQQMEFFAWVWQHRRISRITSSHMLSTYLLACKHCWIAQACFWHGSFCGIPLSI